MKKIPMPILIEKDAWREAITILHDVRRELEKTVKEHKKEDKK